VKLKRIKKGTKRNQDKCAASKCTADATIEFGPGEAFDEKYGTISLCDKHAEELEKELDEQEQKAAESDQMAAVLDLTVRDNMAKEADDAEQTLAMLRNLQVTGQVDIDFAKECLDDVMGRLKRFKALRTKATKKTRETLEEIRSWFKKPISFYEQAEQVLKDKIRDGMDSLQAQQTAQIAAASQAHQAGDIQAVQQLVEAATEAEVHQPDNITRTEHYSFQIENPDIVPRELCSPDDKKIRAYLTIHKGAAIGSIPGVTVWRQDIIGNRGVK